MMGRIKIGELNRWLISFFNTAHHCVNYHPANRIMQDFYHHRLRERLEIPAILGLTASPVVRAKPDQLR